VSEMPGSLIFSSRIPNVCILGRDSWVRLGFSLPTRLFLSPSKLTSGPCRYKYAHGNVELALYPRVPMSWQMWRNATWGLRWFVVEQGMGVEASFVVLQEGVRGWAGSGVLIAR